MRLLILTLLSSALAACGGASPKPVDDSCDAANDCTDPALPYCVEGACHACDGASACTPDAPRCSPADLVCADCVGDIDCSGYPSMPRCNSTDGSCVGCVESSQCANPTPVCDPDTQACRGCSSDDDCASAACDRTTGTCIGEAAVLYASANGPAAALCTKAAPCSFAKAIMTVDATHAHIKLAGGLYTGIEHRIAGATTMAIHGLGATLTTELIIEDGATVRIDDLTIDSRLNCLTSTTAAAIPTVVLDHVTLDTLEVRPCILEIYDSRFTPGPTEQPIRARADVAQRRSTVLLERTLIAGGEGLCFEGSTYDIRNSVIANVTDAAGASAFVCMNSPQAPGSTVQFTTFYNAPVVCVNGVMPSLAISSSIIFSDRSTADAAGCNQATFHYTLASPQAAALPGANNLLGMDPMFAEPAAANLHLLPGSPAIDAADPAAPASVDFDGLSRLGRGDMGAFEYLTPQ